MSDSPKRLVKDKDKKKSFKKASSFSAFLSRKENRRSTFEEEFAKIGTSASLTSEGGAAERVKPEDLLSYSKGGEKFSSESSVEEEEQFSAKEEVSEKMSYFASSITAPAVNQADLEIIRILRTISVDDVLKASTIDIMSKTQAERNDIIIAAVHCMCNGPVGVNKITNFPLITGERSIKSMIDCSNRTWKAFCLHLINDLGFDCAQKCYTKEEFGDLWPKCEGAMKLKAPP